RSPGQQASASPAKPTPAPIPIPLAKVPLEVQSTLATLQEIDANVSGDQSSADAIGRKLFDQASEIDARSADDTRLLTTSPSLDMVYRLKLIWRNFRLRLSVSARELTQHATSLEEQLARLDQLNKIWQATLQSAKEQETPPSVLQRVQSVVDSVARTRQAAESGRDHVLTLQSLLSEEEARVRTTLSSIEQVETRALKNILVRDSRPIWSLETSLGTEWEKDSSESFSSQLETSTAFTKRLPFAFLIHALFIVLMAAALHWMRRRIRKFAEEKPDLQRALPKPDLAPCAADTRSPRFNCLRAFNAPRTLNLRASAPLDSCNHGCRNAYPSHSDSPTIIGTSFVSNHQRDRHHVFRWSTPNTRGVSTGVGQVHISRPNARRGCLSCLGASELAPTGGSY